MKLWLKALAAVVPWWIGCLFVIVIGGGFIYLLLTNTGVALSLAIIVLFCWSVYIAHDNLRYQQEEEASMEDFINRRKQAETQK